MRWDEQAAQLDAAQRLPGYREAVVRHFDAPEAVDTRFYEVRARSILNRVPEASQMPFRWTINPYRGCTHACAYCLSGDTAILMADGRTRLLRDLRTGDRIVGTVRDGRYRRFVETEVERKWSSLKSAFRIELSDGTGVVASGDHRFLTHRGWKYVTGGECGDLRRPHLTLNSELLGPGGHVDPPEHDAEYQRGYLCGIVRGDGHVGTYRDERTGRTNADVHRFRLALADVEALDRAHSFLEQASVGTRRFEFAAAAGSHRAMQAIRTSAEASVERVRQIIEWPSVAADSWARGFLAGIFDAEGSNSRGVLRVCNTDPEIIGWIVTCLRMLEFDSVVESPRGALKVVRLRGGLSERMRFVLMTDPAITRKRTPIGFAVKNPQPKRVVSIAPLGLVMRMYDITTGTGDFIANGVISHNCFARPTHEYLGFDAGRDFEREIVVKVNAPELLRAELRRPSWSYEHVALGTNTDPYQWVEGRYELLPGIWEALRDARNPCSVLTKSPLLLRDLELMKQLTEVTDFSAALSIPTLDQQAWRASEPRSPNPRARIDALAELTRAGIRTGVLVAPLMPGINDAPEQVAEVVRLATEAGAAYVSGIALHLRRGVREVFMAWLSEQRPELVPRYQELYRRSAYLSPAERLRLAQLLDGPQLEPQARRISDWRRANGGIRANRAPPRGEPAPRLF